MDRQGHSSGGRWLRAAAGGMLLLGLAATFGPYFVNEMWSRWFPAWRQADLGLYDRLIGGESYYTHGPLVPLVSLGILLLLVGFTRIVVRPAPVWGSAVLATSLLVQAMGVYARVNFVEGFAFIGVLIGLVLLLWGRAALRRLWFPLVFLAFMVPLPEVTIGDLNFRLKNLATWAGVSLASLVGVMSAYSGNNVVLQGQKELVIANVCNGLRTLISLLAFGALYAYVCRLKGLWRLVLFAATVPVAVVANAVRVAALIVVADVWTVKVATGWFHETSGLMIYVIAFLLMFGLERLILWARRRAGRPAQVQPLFDGVRRGPEDAGQWSRMARAMGRRVGWLAVALLALSSGATYHYRRTIRRTLDTNVVAQAVPQTMTVRGTALHGQPRTISRKALGILETEDYFYSVYSGAGAPLIDFCIIFSRDNRKGIHPPDQCLAGGGNEIVAKGGLRIRNPAGADVSCRELVIQSPGGGRQYYLYTYRCGSSYTGSFWKQQILIFLNGLANRDASGALIRLSAPVHQNRPEEARQWCEEFMRMALPHLDQKLRT